MAENKEQQSPYPLAAAAANGYARSDTELASHDARELRKKKRMKCLLYIFLFAVFQTGIIMLFALTVMKIRTPKFRVRSATFQNFNVTPTNPSFSLRMNAEFGIKNANFGHFKYQNSTVRFFYGVTQVGEVVVQKARAKARSTRKFNAVVELSLANAAAANTQHGNDLSSGVLRLSSKSKLSGKVELMKVLKKKKSTDMNCSMEIVTATQQLRNIVCK